MSHAIMGILTCAKVHSVELDRASINLNLLFLTLINPSQPTKEEQQACLAAYLG